MNKKLIVIIAAIVIIATGAGFLAGQFLYAPQSRSGTKQPLPTDQQPNQAPVVNDTTDNGPPSTDQTPPLSNSIVFSSSAPALVSGSGLFLPPADAYSHVYNVGTVTAGQYVGGELWLATTPGEMGSSNLYHFINRNGTTTYIAKNSDALYDGDGLNRDKFTIDYISDIPSLVFPKKISYENSTFTLNEFSSYGLGTGDNSTLFDDIFKPSNLQVAFVDPTLGNVYIDAPNQTSKDRHIENGFYLKASDGTLRAYFLEVGFFDVNKSLPSVTWDDGTTNTTEYVDTDRGGCGETNYAAVVSGVIMTDLVAAGKASTGDTVYFLKDSHNAILKNIYDNDYNPYNAPKLSYDDFIAARPAFFWYDPFGRLIKFERADFEPQAECGKPVIYLYPPKTTNVSVAIHPQGGMTKSDPAYDGGWNVVATPDGQLTDTKTGQVYPYLFWEGRGGIYQTPKKGFVVRAADVHNFLTDALTKLGLNQNERADFLAFWEPRMTGAPYFFVTFLGNKEMDHLAPLTISPQPDSVIRILMDFTPLQEPIAVEGYDFKTPARNGFTVIEWGGVLR